jgi:hypothetical protein
MDVERCSGGCALYHSWRAAETDLCMAFPVEVTYPLSYYPCTPGRPCRHGFTSEDIDEGISFLERMEITDDEPAAKIADAIAAERGRPL